MVGVRKTKKIRTRQNKNRKKIVQAKKSQKKCLCKGKKKIHVGTGKNFVHDAPPHHITFLMIDTVDTGNRYKEQ